MQITMTVMVIPRKRIYIHIYTDKISKLRKNEENNIVRKRDIERI